MFKNIKNLESGDHIWNHHEKCIQISTNMPGIGLVIREIGWKCWKNPKTISDGKTNGRVLRIKKYHLAAILDAILDFSESPQGIFGDF